MLRLIIFFIKQKTIIFKQRYHWFEVQNCSVPIVTTNLIQYQFFATSTKIATLHRQFLIHMTKRLGNVFSHITHFSSPVFCL